MANNLAIIAKPVGSRCNMNCAYCYYLEKGRFSENTKQTRMSFSLLERLIKRTIEATPGEVVSFTWHGGEPTLAGLDFYKKVVEFEKKHLPRGKKTWNSLQTNGLLLSDEWCDFLCKNGFDVGLSIDGDALTHDANRRDRGGAPTYERVRKAAQRLKKHGVQPDLLCTVSAETVKRPLEVYRALRELDTGWVQFIPIVVRREDGSVDPISVSPEEYGEFLCTVFDEWCMNDLGKLDVQLFAETAKVMAGGEAGVCTLAPTCGQVLVAEEDGSVYACDHFVEPSHKLGNLKSDRLETFATGEFQRKFGEAKRDSLTAECRRCPWLDRCGGFCPKDRFGVSVDGEPGQYYLCAGLKKYFEHSDPILRNIMQLSRNKYSSDRIMQKLREGE